MKTAQSRLRLRLTVLSILALLTLLLPAAALAAPVSAPAESSNSWHGCATYHTVRRGDTLSGIARHYGVSVNSLMQANNIWDPNRIYRGQVLCIPGGGHDGGHDDDWNGGGGGHPGGSCANFHRVRYGETLSGIAAMYGVSKWAIMEANGISNPNRIYAGQKLCIPGGWSPSPKPPPDPCHPYPCPQPKPPPDPCHPYPCQPPPPKPDPCNPYPCPPPDPQPTGQWNATYWANPNQEGASAGSATVGPQLAFNWGRSGPGFGIGADNWSARFTQIVWLDGGTYRFNATSDDGVRVFVTGRQVIDGWRVQAPTSYTGDVTVATGNHEIRVDYFQASGEASLWVEYFRVY
jgi:LysM repeat protein